jgi:YD repeat-containing protein
VYDRAGNRTTFGYSNGKLTSITDPVGRTTQLVFGPDGLIDTVTDYAGRTVTFAHNPDRTLDSITWPDPDEGGSLPAPAMDFGYDPVTMLLTSMTDTAGVTTTYEYDGLGTLYRVSHEHGNSETLNAVLAASAVDTSGGFGTEGNPAGLFRVSTSYGSRTRRWTLSAGGATRARCGTTGRSG